MKQINIFFCSNNGYSAHLWVAIYSLIKNLNKNYFANIYIISEWIEDKNKNKIIKSCNKFKNFNIEFVLIDWQKYKNINNLFPPETFYRLEAPYIFDKLDKIIYLDCDIVVDGDISHIDQEQDGDYYLKAVSAVWMNYYYNMTNNTKNKRFFNAWVLLLNLKKIRQEGLFDLVYKYLIKNKNTLMAWDQDWLNAIFWDKYTEISPKFNAIQFLFYSKNYQNLWYDKQDFLEAKTKPIIIHYTWQKPWTYFCNHPLKNTYRKYRNETLFAEKTNKPIDGFNFYWLKIHITNTVFVFLICNINQKRYYYLFFLPFQKIKSFYRKLWFYK